MIRNEKSLIAFGILVSILLLAIITILFLSSIFSSLLFKSILYGEILSIINFIIGFLLINYGLRKSDKIFLTTLWGGLLFRLILGLSLVILVLNFLEINAYGFIFSILFFYFFYLMIEILYLNFKRKLPIGGK